MQRARKTREHETDPAKCEMAYRMGWIWRILFDLIDGDSEQPEPLTSFSLEGGAAPAEFGQFDAFDRGGDPGQSTDADDKLNGVLINYLGGGVCGTESPDYQDRGMIKVDLVDVLDGLICRGHITQDQVAGIVNSAMGL